MIVIWASENNYTQEVYYHYNFMFFFCLWNVYEGRRDRKKDKNVGRKNPKSIWIGSRISREPKRLDDNSANIEYPESSVFLFLRSPVREWHHASRCFTCLLRCRSSRGAERWDASRARACILNGVHGSPVKLNPGLLADSQ